MILFGNERFELFSDQWIDQVLEAIHLYLVHDLQLLPYFSGRKAITPEPDKVRFR